MRCWRVRRSLLDRPGRPGGGRTASGGALATGGAPVTAGQPTAAQPVGPVEVIGRLAGVQAQVPAAAVQAISVRLGRPVGPEVTESLTKGRVMRTWAMRGTLHLLDSRDAPAYLALLAAGRSWEKGSWQKTFLSTQRTAALRAAVWDALDGPPLTREQLTAAVVASTGDQDLVAALSSGWGAVLKPIAWLGELCHGPAEGNRVTFTRPDRHVPGWPTPPEPMRAAEVVIPAYVGAYGPTDAAGMDQWLTRGTSRRADLRVWWATVEDRLAPVTVEGMRRYVLTEHVEDLMSLRPDQEVRLLPAFDQFVLGPGTADPLVVPQAHRGRVSRAGGWIAPVLLVGGLVAGTWTLDEGRVRLSLLDGTGLTTAQRRSMHEEVAWLEAALGFPLDVQVEP